MPMTMCLLHVHGKQECLVVGPVCDTGLPRFQHIYATSIVAKYLDTVTVKVSKTFYETTFPADIIFTKEYVSTSDEQVEKLNREYNIHYRACIGSLIYLLSTRVDLIFQYTS